MTPGRDLEEAQRLSASSRQVAGPDEPFANAKQYVKDVYEHPQHRLLISQGYTFFVYNGTHWVAVEDQQLRSDLYRYFDAAVYLDRNGEPVRFKPTKSKIANLIDALHGEVHLPADVTSPTWLGYGSPRLAPTEVVSCQNGILHVPTRTIYQHTPRLLSHHSVPFDFDPGAPLPAKWLGFLDQLWPDDHDAIAALQEVAGYLVSGSTRQQKMFLLVGPKRSGKGTIARVLTALVGPHNVVGPTLSSLAQNFGLQPLIGKSLAIIADARLGNGQPVIIERLLSISGEDTLTIDRKNREAWSGRLPTRVVIISNELPRMNDASGALASRFVPFETTRSFYDIEDTELTDKLLAELPGILNWALDGLDRVIANGCIAVPASARELMRDFEDLSSPVKAFVNDRCDLGVGFTESLAALHAAYVGWCLSKGIKHPSTEATFGRDMWSAVPELVRRRPRDEQGNQSLHYSGIRLRRGTESW